MISNIFSSFKGFALPVILGTASVISVGGYGLVSYWSGAGAKEGVFIDDLENKKIQDNLKLSARYFRRDENKTDLTCESLLIATVEVGNVNRKNILEGKDCSNFVNEIWGSDSHNWPLMGLKSNKEQFSDALKSFFFYSNSEYSEEYISSNASWDYGDLRCTNSEKNEKEVVVSCDKMIKSPEGSSNELSGSAGDEEQIL